VHLEVVRSTRNPHVAGRQEDGSPSVTHILGPERNTPLRPGSSLQGCSTYRRELLSWSLSLTTKPILVPHRHRSCIGGKSPGKWIRGPSRCFKVSSNSFIYLLSEPAPYTFEH